MSYRTLFHFSSIFVFLFFNLSNIAHANFAGLFNITVKNGTTLPTTVVQNRTTTAYYTVSNNTAIQRNSVFVKYLPLNVTQVVTNAPGTCGATFDLAPVNQAGSSCTLILSISGPVTNSDPNPEYHLYVCLQGGTACSATTQPLQVSAVPLYQTAVGYYFNGSIDTSLSYDSSDGGKSWQTSTTLPPNMGVATHVNSASCSSNGLNCAAVGYQANGDFFIPASFYSTNGGKDWLSSVSSPPAQGSAAEILDSISCSGSQCAAVGSFHSIQNFYPLAYYSTDNGQTWLSSTLPSLPNGSLANPLSSIACGGLNCTAVGYSYNGTALVPASYYSNNGGANWFLSNTQPTALSNTHFLTSVACDPTGTKCTAVGYYNNGTAYTAATFYSTNGGINWLTSTTQPTRQGDSTTPNFLFGAACAGTSCTTVGYYNGGTDSIPYAFYSVDGGQNWSSSATLPLPTGATASTLSSVSCDTTTQFCTAVGDYTNGTVTAPLSYYSNDAGQTWEVSTTLPPPAVVTGINTLRGIGGG